MTKPLSTVTLIDVDIKDAFWSPRITVNREVTLPLEYSICKKTGRIDEMKLKTIRTGPHEFFDSDVGKWIEAAAYSLELHADKELEEKVDQYVGDMEKAQTDDGYLNSHFQTMDFDKRWTNLRLMHELYCAGHLTEAAVAYEKAIGHAVRAVYMYAGMADVAAEAGDTSLLETC